jgi:hypothetical protein
VPLLVCVRIISVVNAVLLIVVNEPLEPMDHAGRPNPSAHALRGHRIRRGCRCCIAQKALSFSSLACFLLCQCLSDLFCLPLLLREKGLVVCFSFFRRRPYSVRSHAGGGRVDEHCVVSNALAA